VHIGCQRESRVFIGFGWVKNRKVSKNGKDLSTLGQLAFVLFSPRVIEESVFLRELRRG